MTTVNEIKTALFLACVELGANNSLWVSNNMLFKPANTDIVTVFEHERYISVIVTDTMTSHLYEMFSIFPNDETTETQFNKAVTYIKNVWC